MSEFNTRQRQSMYVAVQAIQHGGCPCHFLWCMVGCFLHLPIVANR